MSWNYRIIRHRTKGVTWYGLHEVYYTKKGKMNLWAPEPEATGDTVRELVASLAMMLRDATKYETPILNKREMPGEGKSQRSSDRKVAE